MELRRFLLFLLNQASGWPTGSALGSVLCVCFAEFSLSLSFPHTHTHSILRRQHAHHSVYPILQWQRRLCVFWFPAGNICTDVLCVRFSNGSNGSNVSNVYGVHLFATPSLTRSFSCAHPPRTRLIRSSGWALLTCLRLPSSLASACPPHSPPLAFACPPHSPPRALLTRLRLPSSLASACPPHSPPLALLTRLRSRRSHGCAGALRPFGSWPPA